MSREALPKEWNFITHQKAHSELEQNAGLSISVRQQDSQEQTAHQLPILRWMYLEGI